MRGRSFADSPRGESRTLLHTCKKYATLSNKRPSPIVAAPRTPRLRRTGEDIFGVIHAEFDWSMHGSDDGTTFYCTTLYSFAQLFPYVPYTIYRRRSRVRGELHIRFEFKANDRTSVANGDSRSEHLFGSRKKHRVRACEPSKGPHDLRTQYQHRHAGRDRRSE
jgi:hypothetical protein